MFTVTVMILDNLNWALYTFYVWSQPQPGGLLLFRTFFVY